MKITVHNSEKIFFSSCKIAKRLRGEKNNKENSRIESLFCSSSRKPLVKGGHFCKVKRNQSKYGRVR